MDKAEIKEVVQDVIDRRGHTCILTEEDLLAIKTVSGFLTRCRNALGNFFMVLLAVLAVIGIGGLMFLISGGHINMFKLIGIGS